MKNILEANLLNTWEGNADTTPIVRSLSLLELNCPNEPIEALFDWPLGRRDNNLLELREKLFGQHITGVAKCPKCESEVELYTETVSIRTTYASDTSFKIEIKEDDGKVYCVELRAINSRDILETLVDRNALLKRCIIAVKSNEGKLETEQFIRMSPDLVNECARALAECDPQADVDLELICSECGFQWDAPFDIASYLWQEIDTWARRILREIHLIASAYGWSQQEILNLSPRRRRSYLEMVVE